MKRIYLICVLLCLAFLLCACSTKQEPNQQQLQCEHEWVEIDWHLTYGGVLSDIYCPKCQLEQSVNAKELNKIQADINFKNKLSRGES